MPQPVVTGAPAHTDAAGVSLVLRVPVFATGTVALAVSAHVGAGGAVPRLDAVAILLLAVAVGWRALARSEQSMGRLLIGVLAVQGCAHVMLADAHGHHEGALQGVHQATGMPGPAMWAAHCLATLCLAWWLRRGEAATWRAVRRLLPLILAFVAPPVGQPAPARVRPQFAPLVVRAMGLRPLLADRRRGPPAGN